MQPGTLPTGQDIDAVIFDFDLTLADSLAGAAESINFALRQMGHGTAGQETIRRMMGLSLEETFRQLTDSTDPAAAVTFRSLFKQRADEVVAPKTWIYPAAPAAVASLRSAGLKLAIVSNKFRYRIEEILQREGLDHLFDTIVGWEDASAGKPDPAGLLLAVQRLGTKAATTLYVGDSLVDAETARRAEVLFAAVLTGATTSQEFTDHPVAAVLPDVGNLPDLLGLEERPLPESARLRREAAGIVEETGLLSTLTECGQAGLKGSVALDLVVKRDIDFDLVAKGDLLDTVDHVYHQLLNIKGVREVRITDYRAEGGIKIGIDDYAGPSGSWSIDIWITNRTETTGAALVRRLRRTLLPEHRKAILRIKRLYHERDLLRDGLSTRIYRAVLDHGVRTPEQFERFLDQAPKQEI
jgi:phosphoglycolate phosphatase